LNQLDWFYNQSPYSRGRFHQHFCPTFLSKQVEKLLLVNGIWQMANRFGKRRINLVNFTLPHLGKVQGRMLVKLNENFFCQMLSASIFLLGAQGFGEIDPSIQSMSYR